MKYLLHISQGTAPTPRSPDRWEHRSEDEQNALDADYRLQGGHQTPGVSAGLVWQAAEQTAITVRVGDGEALVITGLFVASEQALDSCLLFEAEALDTAIELTSCIPAVRLGGAAEGRPIVERSS